MFLHVSLRFCMSLHVSARLCMFLHVSATSCQVPVLEIPVIGLLESSPRERERDIHTTAHHRSSRPPRHTRRSSVVEDLVTSMIKETNRLDGEDQTTGAALMSDDSRVGASSPRCLYYDNFLKVFRMRFSIVENLSGLRGNIFSLFRKP